MKKLLISLVAVFTFFGIQAQDDLPVNASFNFAGFDKAVKNLDIENYNCMMTGEDPAAYSCMFSINDYNGMITAINAAYYTLGEDGDEDFILVKEYEIDGMKTRLGKNRFEGSEEVPMNVMFVLFEKFNATIVINADMAIPVETLESIVRKLSF